MPPGTDCPYPVRIFAFFEMIRPESFRVLNVFAFVFDSENSVADIVADEMLNLISLKRDDSGSVGRFASATQSKRLHLTIIQPAIYVAVYLSHVLDRQLLNG